MMKKFLCYLSVITLLTTGCNLTSKGPDVSHIDVNVEPQLFFIDLFEMNEDELPEAIDAISKKYGSYLDAYSQQIIKIGSPSNPEYPDFIKSFLDYEDNRDVYEACKKQFGKTNKLSSDLTKAFKHYKYYFPDATIPQVYFHTSYFNQSIAMDSTWISVSVEKYLGADCQFYEWLSIPFYLRRKMVPEKIVPDIMKAMALGNFSLQMKNEDVLSRMIAQGKLNYFVKQMMPSIQDTLLFDYSKKQIKWCYRHEGDIWASMVEQKHLYNTERMVIQKYVGDSPFTYYFGQDSPGKAAVFIAYRIIDAYMKNHPETNLNDLLNNTDAHQILRESRYRP
ncbi:gliding motility protein GldB [Carboxylicivirga mesophila]|uniref:Gliding motility protein GldB n=1 Tax=Carboxylicivirga mesophila TaxID=1166478 RepID=A0ABS5KA00_9BACT|nr:gliding motility protein GldB [Carboxylicivirga mesophila]MBS2211351.1 gliding motility protein GldB [Carboxylicivirga mesophila]